MNNKKNIQEIIYFVAKYTNTPSCKIYNKTRIFHDLHTDGDDAFELLEDYSKKFDVDISEMKINDYFDPEGVFNPIGFLFCLLFRRDKLKLKPLTIEDLARGVETKKLV